MIEAAVILSGVVRHWMDFVIILLLLCSNAVVGFWEEHQAGNAIAALKSNSQSMRAPCETESGSTRRPATSCQATLCACVWETSCQQTRACWQAIRWKSISRH